MRTMAKRKTRRKKTKAQNKIRKPRKVRIKQETRKTTIGTEYNIWIDPPEELLPTEEHIGKILEVAGQNDKKEFNKLYNIAEDHITCIDVRGQFRAYKKESCILNRDEVKRESTDRIMDIIRKKVKRRGKK